jgi:uncharacterized membrane protein YoaK (UPF0700 family)
VFIAQAHSFTQQARLAITLAWIAGFTNIVCIIVCGYATSHVSGTVSQWGRDLVEGKWDLLTITSYLIATFFLGAVASAICTETGRRRGWESIYVLPMTIQAMLLCTFAIGAELYAPEEIRTGTVLYLMLGLASSAMGLQNATITRISGGVVRTTHMTGVVTDLGTDCVHSALAVLDWSRAPRERRPALWSAIRTNPSARRVSLLASIAGSFALGAGLGAFCYEKLPQGAMFAPVAFLLWIVFQDVRMPICEIEESSEVDQETGLTLPKGLGVFHLRRNAKRSKRAHRIPDLFAWSDRLPAATRVVVLDLHGAARIDDNAAVELRALAQHFEKSARVLIIAGVGREAFGALERVGAGDLLRRGLVWPDYELALARGFELAVERSG